MPENAPIPTFSTETFRQQFMMPGEALNDLLKSDYGSFFITRVENMLRLIRLPLPPTRATTHSLIYLTEGEAIMTIGSETYRIHQDEMFVVAAGQIFSFGNYDVNKGYLINFHADFCLGPVTQPEGLKTMEMFSVWGNPVVKLGSLSPFVAALFRRLLDVYSQDGLSQKRLLQTYLVSLLCEIDGAYRPLSASKRIRAVAITNQFKALLHQHIHHLHRVSEYADLLAVTPNHLNKVVKQLTAKSPTRWIDEALVVEAKVLLYQTDVPISAIAAQLGILDASYFSRLFKRYAGCTPLEFRKRIETSYSLPQTS
jgi:AraC family transcriptional regulator, transcriptional activator of pobA